MVKLNSDYNITKKGVIRSNPNVMPYDLLMSINRAHADLKAGRYTEETLPKNLSKMDMKLIKKAWKIRREGEFEDWDKVKDDIRDGTYGKVKK